MTEIWEREDHPEEDFESANNENIPQEMCLIKVIVIALLFIQMEMGFLSFWFYVFQFLFRNCRKYFLYLLYDKTE